MHNQADFFPKQTAQQITRLQTLEATAATMPTRAQLETEYNTWMAAGRPMQPTTVDKSTGEITNAPRQAVPDEKAVDLSHVPSGSYAYQPPDGQAQFYKIDNLRLTPNPNNPKWDGWIFVKAQLSDELTKAGSQRPNANTYTGDRWRAMQAIAANPEAACSLYGHTLGRCGICGRTLTNEESRGKGIGPICAERFTA